LFRNGSVCIDCVGKKFAWPAIYHKCYHNSILQSFVVSSMLSFHAFLKTWQREVDLFIALTTFSRNLFIQAGIPSEKIIVSPNFVLSDPGNKNNLGNYVLFVGRLSEEKGVKTLLESWKDLNIPLKIAGVGDLFVYGNQFVKDNGLTNVEFLGFQSKNTIFRLMKNARFLVFPSTWYEGFPMTIAESFACGLPVLASDLGAMKEIIIDHYSGLLFKPGDSEDLKEKVSFLWNNIKAIKFMSNNARNEYEIKYSADQKYKLLLKIYDQVKRNNEQ